MSKALVWFALPAGLVFHFVAPRGKQENVGTGGACGKLRSDSSSFWQVDPAMLLQ